MNDATTAAIAELLDASAYGDVLDELDSQDDPSTHWYRVEALFGLEDWDELEPTVFEALEAGPAPPGRGSVMLGYVALNQGQLDEAGASFDEALEETPDAPDALRGRAGVQRLLGQEAAANESLRAALGALPHPDSDLATGRNLHRRAQVLRDLGMLALENDDYANAELHWQAAADARPDEGDHHLDLARLYLHMGRLEDAAAFAAKATHATPLLVEGYALGAQALCSQQRFTEALALVRQGIDVDPEEPFSLAALAHTHLMAGDFEAALVACDQAIDLDPAIPDPYQIKATALTSLGRESAYRQEDAQFLQMEPMLPTFIDGGLFGAGPSLDDVLEQVAQMSPDDLRNAAESALQSGLLPEAMRPMVESMMGQLPQLMQQLPSLLGGPGPLTEVPQAPTGPLLQGEELRKNLRVIDGGKDSDG